MGLVVLQDETRYVHDQLGTRFPTIMRVWISSPTNEVTRSVLPPHGDLRCVQLEKSFHHLNPIMVVREEENYFASFAEHASIS